MRNMKNYERILELKVFMYVNQKYEYGKKFSKKFINK